MILQVHDELNFNVYKEEAEVVKKIVLEEMENVMKLQVPLIADCGEERTGWRRIKIMPEFPLKKHVRVFRKTCTTFPKTRTCFKTITA